MYHAFPEAVLKKMTGKRKNKIFIFLGWINVMFEWDKSCNGMYLRNKLFRDIKRIFSSGNSACIVFLFIYFFEYRLIKL